MTDTSITDKPTAPNPVVEACKADRLKLILSIAAMAYIVLITLELFHRGIPTGEAGGVVTTLAGGALLLVKDCYSFVFGSSQGSQDKTAQINSMTATAAAAPTPPPILEPAAPVTPVA